LTDDDITRFLKYNFETAFTLIESVEANRLKKKGADRGGSRDEEENESIDEAVECTSVC
jgi:hypothetical protein